MFQEEHRSETRMKDRYLWGSLIFGLLTTWTGTLVYNSHWGKLGLIPWLIIAILYWIDMCSKKNMEENK